MSSIGFLNSLVEYYFPRLDVSILEDDKWIEKIAHLLKIRQMEKISAVEKVLKNFME